MLFFTVAVTNYSIKYFLLHIPFRKRLDISYITENYLLVKTPFPFSISQ